MISPVLKIIGTEKKFITLLIVFVIAVVLFIHPAAAQITSDATTGNEFATTATTDTNTDSSILPSSDTLGTNDYFLKIDGIPGESTVKGHANEIELKSFSWGLSQANVSKTGAGGGAGKAVFDEFNFRALVSKASPLLFLNTAKGTHIKEVILTVRKAGENPIDYYKVTMSDVLISSYHSTGNNGGQPVDNVSLTFGKIEFEYKVQNSEGDSNSVKGGWDLKTNKGL